MKKLRCLTAALLSVSVLASGAALTACNKDDGEEAAKTTVENAEEWKAAFTDFFKVDSLHARMYYNSVTAYNDGTEYEMHTNGDSYVNFKSGQTLAEYHEEAWEDDDYYHEIRAVNYNEISGDSICYYGTLYQNFPGEDIENEKWAGKKDDDFHIYEEKAVEYYISDMSEIEIYEYSSFLFNNPYTMFALFRVELCTEDDTDNMKFLPEWFSEFTYENGCYVSNSLGTYDYFLENPVFIPCQIKVEIKNGIVYRIEMTHEETTLPYEDEDVQVPGGVVHSTYGFTVDGINSTTVTLPEGAREAIDAEKAKENN